MRLLVEQYTWLAQQQQQQPHSKLVLTVLCVCHHLAKSSDLNFCREVFCVHHLAKSFLLQHSGLRGGSEIFLPLGSTGTFFSTLKVPRASSHFPDTKFVKFGTSRAQKRPKNSPNRPKWRSEGSGGPKRVEQRGTKVERAVGGPSRRF